MSESGHIFAFVPFTLTSIVTLFSSSLSPVLNDDDDDDDDEQHIPFVVELDRQAPLVSSRINAGSTLLRHLQVCS